MKIKNDMRQTWKNINRQLGKVKYHHVLLYQSITLPLMIQNRSLITSMTTLLILLAN